MSQKGMGYFVFCGRCGTPETPDLRPKLTLRLRYIKVDTEGTLYLNSVCEVCLTPIEVPWTVEEHLKAIEEAKRQHAGLTEDDLNQFRNELDDGIFPWEEFDDDDI